MGLTERSGLLAEKTMLEGCEVGRFREKTTVELEKEEIGADFLGVEESEEEEGAESEYVGFI